MKPRSEVYNMDCLEYMKTIPDKFFDLCIADPPYGIDAANMNMGKSEHCWKKMSWDKEIPTDSIFQQIFRVSKNAIIWGGNYFNLPSTNAWIVWDKGHDGKLSFSDGELAWTNLDINLRIKKIIRQHTLDYDKIRVHPTQKPVKLYSWLLDNFAKEGDSIFDPFLGSGSSRIAAFKKGFDFYACELDKEYFEVQEKRFKKECMGIEVLESGKTIIQTSLF